MGNAKVFISYSHDSPEHSERVLELARSLRGNGIDVELDQRLDTLPDSQIRPRG